MKKTMLLLMMVMLTIAVKADNAMLNIGPNPKASNTKVYVLVGNFNIQNVEPNYGGGRWGRGYQPNYPPRQRPGMNGNYTYAAYDYVDHFINSMYNVVGQGFRTKTMDIRSESQLQSFLRSHNEPVYALSGMISQMDITEKDSPQGFIEQVQANIRVSFTLTDLRTNQIIDQWDQNGFGMGLHERANPHSAMEEAIKNFDNNVLGHLNDKFPVYGSVMQISDMDGKKVKSMYIDLGSNEGLQQGNHLHVYAANYIGRGPYAGGFGNGAVPGGTVAYEKVGSIRVDQINGPEVAHCTVASGGKDIKRALDAGKRLVVASFTSLWE